MWLVERVYQVLTWGYHVMLVPLRALTAFWVVVVAAMSYTVGAVIRVILIVVIEGVTLYGSFLLLVEYHNLFVAFFVFVAGETAVVYIGFYLFQTLLTFRLAPESEDQGYSPLEGDRPVDAPDAPDPLSF